MPCRDPLSREATRIYHRMYYNLHSEEINTMRRFNRMHKRLEAEKAKVPPPPPPSPKKSKKKKPPMRMTIETQPSPFILSFD